MFSKLTSRFLVSGLLGLFMVIGLAQVFPIALAAEFIPADSNNGNVTLSTNDTHHNAYTAGGTVLVNSNITGDLYSAGGTVTVEGSVEQDAVIAGGTVILNGKVGGDVRIAGGTVTINGPVAGDVLVAGGTVLLTEKASVGRDLAITGGSLTIDAPVVGSVKIQGGVLTLNSKIEGDVIARVDQELIIGSKADIKKISYHATREANVSEGARLGEVDFQKVEHHRGGHAGNVIASIFTIVFVVKVLAMLLAGLLLMRLFPRTSRIAVAKICDRPWLNLGIGALVLFVAPIVGIVILFTFLGMYIAITAFLVWLLLLMFAALTSSVFVGSWIIKKLTKKSENQEPIVDWQSLLIGIVALSIIMLVPVIGGLFFFILLLISFGSMLRMLFDHIKSEQGQLSK